MIGQLPHYQGRHDVLSELDTSVANTGLLFNRFFNRYDLEWQIKDEGEGSNKESVKVSFLRQLLSSRKLTQGRAAVGDQQQLKRYCEKHCLLSERLGGINVSYKSEWNWVTGLGYNHPVENGLLWHQTLGVPYFPGSSVKGLVRAWMETQEAPDLVTIYKWFGSDTTKVDECIRKASPGALIFFDAVPEEPVNLVIDVMTPHTGNWLLEGKKENAPGDWVNPVPVFFLSCSPARLKFSVAPVPGMEDKINMAEVGEALKEALDFLGLGAKTSNGYGFFTPAD